MKKNQEAHITGADIIKNMERDEFCRVCVRKLFRTKPWTQLANLGVSGLSPEQRQELRKILWEELGIPFEMTETDRDISIIRLTTMSRAVNIW